jgi:ribose/xylose/arabinose/galactoside ABC-type transport system permease subunit
VTKKPIDIRKKINLKNIDLHRSVITLLILVMVLIAASVVRNFFSLGNLKALVNSFVLEAIMTLGMTLVIISGGIDLSIAGILPFSAIIFAKFMQADVHYIFAGVLTLFFASLIGYINNLLRRILNIHPFIITTATLLLLKGVNLALTDGRVISKFPENFEKLVGLEFFGIPFPVVIFILLAVLYFILLNHNRYFVRVFFVGGNLQAAKLSGIDVEKVLSFVYTQSGFLAGLAGILAVTIYNSASSNFGQGAELRVITAVALGGTSLTQGGIGSISGTLLGTLFLALTYNIFIMSGFSTYYQDVMTGTMLVIAIAFSEQAKVLRKFFEEKFAKKIPLPERKSSLDK